MAISPYRVSILRGVNAMARGVKNPYGKPQLSSAPVNKPKLASSQRGFQPRPNKAETSQGGGNKPPSLSGTFKTSRVTHSKPALRVLGRIIALRRQLLRILLSARKLTDRVVGRHLILVPPVLRALSVIDSVRCDRRRLRLL